MSLPSKEYIVASKKFLNGFLPIYKPQNICAQKLLYCLKSEIYYNLDRFKLKHGKIEVNYARHLPPYASGVLTFVLGYGYYMRRNFVHAEYKYKLKVEFGVQREFDTIDGHVLDYCSNIDHINRESIEENLKKFNGQQIIQKSVITYSDKDIRKLHVDNDNLIVQSLYRLMQIDSDEYQTFRKYKLLSKANQKYPFKPARESFCHVNLINYSSPYAWLDITTKGSFNITQFVNDFANSLNTKASQVELIRVQEGPTTIDDLRLVQFHENNIETYIDRIQSFEETYKNYLKTFDEMFESPIIYKRNRIK